MPNDEPIPLLMRLYFGDQAGMARGAASHRLQKWSRAFDRWMAELEEKRTKSSTIQAKRAWSLLARKCGKLPWNVTQEDIEEHISRLREEGYDKGYIYIQMRFISRFYEWCAASRVDAACESGFNPARKASVKCDTPYEGAVIWSKEEVRRLVELTERDQSPMGRREAAFLRLRLSSGVANKDILQLKWEQIERKEGQAWVRWRTDAEPVKLEDETWQAMREWLTTSGRWEGMDRGKYIFTPRRPPKQEWTGWKAEDWVEEKPLSARMNRDSLIITGRRLGIDEAKLSWAGLRLTAIKLRLEAGESETGMIQFKQSRDRVEHLRSKLAILPRLAETEGRLLANPEMRCRHNALFKEGEGTTHGIYMRKKDPLAVQKVMDENIHGIEQEKKCLRRLMKGLRERDLNGERLAEAYSMAAGRLAEIIQASRSIRDTGSEDEKSLQDLRAAIERYKEQVGPLPSHDNGQSAGGDEDPLGGDLWEEVATLRLMLRQIDNRSGACTDDFEYLRLVNLYGLLCTRLVKLVKLEGSQATRIREEFNRIVDQAISQVRKDMGLGPEGRK